MESGYPENPYQMHVIFSLWDVSNVLFIYLFIYLLCIEQKCELFDFEPTLRWPALIFSRNVIWKFESLVRSALCMSLIHYTLCNNICLSLIYYSFLM